MVTLGDLKLRYTTFIGDMVAKTFACLTELLYGEDVEIVKHECVGHVQKHNEDGASEVEEVWY